MVSRNLLILLGILLCITAVQAAGEPAATITYTISPQPDGSGLWSVEYRVLLPTQVDVIEFEREMKDSIALPPSEVQGLMERSASAAAMQTGRPMEIQEFSSSSAVQTTPTGTHGVVRYSFRWTGFFGTGNEMAIGDVFIGGLYLSRETTLILHPPQGYTVASAEPLPDQSRGDLIWYGPRSFQTGEPRILLSPPALPLVPVLFIIAVVTGGAGTLAWFVLRRRNREGKLGGTASPGNTDEPDGAISETELASIEERIVKLLRENGGALYQSEIIKRLGAPKSTVSSALNGLHAKGLIQKVRKGRENLIRLV
jgi:hypothetical protein